MGLADPKRWPRARTGDRGGVPEQSSRCRSQGARTSHQLCTWPQERHYPVPCHRKPRPGHGLWLRVTTFPGGWRLGLCAPCRDQHTGARGWGAGSVEASSTSSSLSSSFFLSIFYPLPILPFSYLCRQKLPAALWACSTPQGGQPQPGCLTRRRGHSET